MKFLCLYRESVLNQSVLIDRFDCICDIRYGIRYTTLIHIRRRQTNIFGKSNRQPGFGRICLTFFPILWNRNLLLKKIKPIQNVAIPQCIAPFCLVSAPGLAYMRFIVYSGKFVWGKIFQAICYDFCSPVDLGSKQKVMIDFCLADPSKKSW